MTLHLESSSLIGLLVEKAQSGDRVAFDQLVSEPRGRLEALVSVSLGAALRGKVETEDVLQEAFLRAFRSIDNFKYENRTLLFRWLATITHRVIRDAARWHRVRPVSPLNTDVAVFDVSPSKGIRRHERFERLQNALDSLSPDHRQVIILARLEGLPLKAVGERMGRSDDAVAQLLSRALRKLRTLFGDTESLHLPDRVLEDLKDDHAE